MTTTNERPGQASRYLDYLPAVFQEDAQSSQPNFLGRFLLAFEHVLTGRGDNDPPGLEEILDGITPGPDGVTPRAGVERYFDPGPYPPPNTGKQAPAEFLEWLAGWVALTLRADLDEIRQRSFIARAVSLYRLRGTKRGIEEAVRLYTVLGATIDEMNTAFQLGVHSTIGVDTLLEGGAPHFFRVLSRLPTADPAEQLKYRQVVAAIVDMEKPAHTQYAIDVATPTLQIGVNSTVGVDTLLGPAPH